MISKKLHSEFTFGFEFEGFAKLAYFMDDVESYEYDIENWNELPCNGLYDDDYSCFYESVNNFINDSLNVTKGKTHYDGSVKNFSRGYQSFEYSSPVFKFTPRNIKKIKDFFKNMESYGFGINSTCGFHTHISFSKINEVDAIWTLCQIANNIEYSDEFCYMKTPTHTINFYSDRYANKDFLENIRIALKNNDINSLISNVNGDKYRVIRIHPQGTLEWRGPRDFLYVENGIDLFINKLSKIMSILSKSINAKELNGMTKSEFFDKIYEYKKNCYFDGYTLPFSSKIIKRKGKVGLTDSFGKDFLKYSIRDVASKLAKNIIKNPEKLLSMDNDIFFNHIIDYLKHSDSVSSVLNKLVDNKNVVLSDDIQIKLVNHFPSYLYILTPSAFKKANINTVFGWIENMKLSYIQNKDIEKTIKFVLRNVNNEYLMDCSLAFINNASWSISPILDLIKEGVYKDKDILSIYNRYRRSFNLNNSFNLLTSEQFSVDLETLHKTLKTYMKEGLIKDITENQEFGEEYSNNGSYLPSFFVVDTLGSFINQRKTEHLEIVPTSDVPQLTLSVNN